MAPSPPRCEPVLGWPAMPSPHMPSPAAPSPAASPPPPAEPAGEPVATGETGRAALPWIALAAAALVLATPVFASLRPGAVETIAVAVDTGREAAPAGREPRLADEDEVAFGRFTLRLAGASSADDLWHRWAEMKQRRLGLFDDLTAAVRPAGTAPAAGYQLLVGDFRNAATAAEACGTLRARFLACEVVNRDGTNLRPQG